MLSQSDNLSDVIYVIHFIYMTFCVSSPSFKPRGFLEIIPAFCLTDYFTLTLY